VPHNLPKNQHGHDTNGHAGRPAPPTPAAALEPLAVGRGQVAALFSVSLPTLDRWDASGQLGPVGVRKNGRKLWILKELKAWAAAGMPCRKDWLAMRSATGGRR
jgi:hypothetical protein